MWRKTMNLIFTILFISFFSSSLYGQVNDTCQCRLVYGNGLFPTLVTYHHDSLVTYTNALIPNDTLIKLGKRYQFKDTIFGLEMYNWDKKGISYFIKDGNIGRSLKGEFYTEFTKEIKDSGNTINTFWIGQFYLMPNVDFLYGRKTFFERPTIINNQTCNCFNTLDYFYKNSQINNLNYKKLDSIKFTDSDSTEDSNIFIPTDSRCWIGVEKSKTCYLKGIGTINISEPYPKEIKLNIVYLDKECDKFLTNKFKY